MKQSAPSLAELIALAQTAGQLMQEAFARSIQTGIMPTEKKVDKTVVTETDRHINNDVIKRLKDVYPELDIVGEEASLRRVGAEFQLVLDPIDGTLPFTLYQGGSSVMLAVLRNGIPVRSVIFEPLGKIPFLFSAERGRGAYLHLPDSRCNCDHVLVSWVKVQLGWGV